MIEVVYKDEKQHAKGNEGVFQLPRNVRQIGMTDQNYRIYMEDYVYTFLGRAAASGESNEEKERCLAVFMGETKWDAGTGYLFIRGALLVEGEEISQEHVEFTDAMWQQIHGDAEKYFEGEEIVGWFLGGRMQPMEVSEMILRTHLKHFGGEKVLMLMDPTEKEEAFFRYENGFMVKQSGFYIYYKKNPQMQNYMIEKSPELSAPQEEVHDDAVRAFRQIIQKKHIDQPKEETGRTSVFSYAATACLALAVLTVGVQFYQNYSHNKISQEVAETASGVAGEIQTSGKSTVTQMPKNTVETKVTTKPQVTVTPRTEEKTKPTPTSAMEQNQNISPTPEPRTENEIYREESDDRKAEQRVRQQLAESAGTEAKTGKSDTAETTAGTTTGTGSSYVIKPGDTLYQISIEKYGTMEKVAEICQANGITENEIIYPGQIIVLP